MPALSFCSQARLARAGAIQAPRRARLVVARAKSVKPKQGAAQPKEDAAQPTAQPKLEDAAPSTSGQPEEAPSSNITGTREFTSYGARIIESDAKLTGPEDEKDFWEGDNMETLGKVMERFFVPGLVVLGLICGGIAARSYNEDADVFIAPPSGPDADVVVISAGALAPAPTIVEAPPPAAAAE